MNEKNISVVGSLKKHDNFVADVCQYEDMESGEKRILTVSHDGFLFVHEQVDDSDGKSQCNYSLKEKHFYPEKPSYIRGEIKFCCVVTNDRSHLLITERVYALVINLPDFRLKKRIKVMDESIMCNIWRAIEITDPDEDNKIKFATCVSYANPRQFSGTIKVFDLEGNIIFSIEDCLRSGINAMYQLITSPNLIICGGFTDQLNVIDWKNKIEGKNPIVNYFSKHGENEGMFTNCISGFFTKGGLGEERIISASGDIQQCTGDGIVVIWNLQGEKVGKFRYREGIVCMLKFSDTFFLFGGNDGSIHSLHLFETTTSTKEFVGIKKLEVKESHREYVWDMCWISPFQFVSCGHDETTKVYSVRDRYLDVMSGHQKNRGTREYSLKRSREEKFRLEFIFNLSADGMDFKTLRIREMGSFKVFKFLTIWSIL